MSPKITEMLEYLKKAMEYTLCGLCCAIIMIDYDDQVRVSPRLSKRRQETKMVRKFCKIMTE